MKHMEELAYQYCRKHKGSFTKVTDYSFEWHSPMTKEGKETVVVVMLSYLTEV